MTFGQKLKEARTTKKLTQKQLADAVEAKHNSVSDWENDKNKPDPDTIELLCGVLDITPNYLLKSNSGDFSLAEKQIIKKYRELDAHGKEMVDFTLQKEWERCVDETEEPYLLAAHEDEAPADEKIADLQRFKEEKLKSDKTD